MATLLVILFHVQTVFGAQGGFLPFNNMFFGGHRGVDLFFVISGFIIAYVHSEDLGQPYRLKNYIFNRATRIYPAVWIMTALSVALYSIGYGSQDKAAKLAPASIVASAFLLPQHGVPLVNVTWTLTYEIFFYLLFAVSIVNTRFGFTLLLAWQVTTLAVALSGVDLNISGYYLRALCLDFSVGLACAWWLRRFRTSVAPPSVWFALLAVGVASFATGMWLDGAVSWAGTSCALASGTIILALVRLEQTGHLQVPEFFVWIGAASYSIYLVHYSTLQLLSGVFRRLGVPVTNVLCVAYVVIGILAGLAFDSWVDKPVQRRLRRLKPLLIQSSSEQTRIGAARQSR